MKNYFVFEFWQQSKAKKTIGIFIVSLLAVLYFSLVSMRQFLPIENVNDTEISQRYAKRQGFIDEQSKKSVEELGQQHWAVQMAIQKYQEWAPTDKARMDAIKKDDWQAYAKGTAEFYRYALIHTDNFYVLFTPAYYTFDNYYPDYDGRYGYGRTQALMEGYAKLPKSKLSRNVMNEKTGIQAVARAFTTFLPYLLLGAFLFLGIDVLLKDKRHRTLLEAYPLSVNQLLTVKSLVFLTIAALLTVTCMAVIYLVVGLQYGFGSWRLPLAVFSEKAVATQPIFDSKVFETEAIGWFLLKCLGCALFFAAVYVRILMLLSLWFRFELVNLFVGGLALVATKVYTWRFMSTAVPRHNFLYLYQDFGNILTGYDRFYFGSAKITMAHGLLLFAGLWLAVEVLLFFTTHRRKFKLFK